MAHAGTSRGRRFAMKTVHLLALGMVLAPLAAAPAQAQTRAGLELWQQAQRRFDRERSIYGREPEMYDNAVARDRARRDRDSYATDYDAARHYRDDPRYRERRLGPDDYVYRGSDGRYYCRR